MIKWLQNKRQSVAIMQLRVSKSSLYKVCVKNLLVFSVCFKLRHSELTKQPQKENEEGFGMRDDSNSTTFGREALVTIEVRKN